MRGLNRKKESARRLEAEDFEVLTWCHPHHCTCITLAKTVASWKCHDPLIETVGDEGSETEPDKQAKLVIRRVCNERAARDQDDRHRKQRCGQKDGKERRYGIDESRQTLEERHVLNEWSEETEVQLERCLYGPNCLQKILGSALTVI